MKYIDIHCHLDFPDYGKDLKDVFARMVERGVGAISIGTDLESSKRAVKIAEENKNVWACIGMHPIHDSERNGGRFDEGEFEILVQNSKVVAIGECGLDYFRIKDESEKIKQKELFKKQIEFALRHNKPLMLHCRNAYDEVLDVLESYKRTESPEAVKLRGNTHFFAGNIEQAKRFLGLNFTMSFTGVITFTHDYDEVIRFLPEDSIMSETDAPFVAPTPHRGKRNEPSYVIEIAKKMAEIRGKTEEQMAKVVVNNAVRLFKLK